LEKPNSLRFTAENTWRWFHKALPLKERIYWSTSIDSIFCHWCPTSPQTHTHFLLDCVFTKKIIKEIKKNLGNFPNIEDDWQGDLRKLKKTSLWITAWIINFSWTTIAKLNLDPELSEEEFIYMAPHVFREDVKSYTASCNNIDRLKRVSFCLNVIAI
jgi:hypothetical protein